MTALARCPSDLALEAHLLDPERSEIRPHLTTCGRCQGRLARMEAEGEEFRRFVFPATVEKVEDAVAPRRTKLLRFLVPFASLAASAAAVMLVVRIAGLGGADGPGPDYVGTKGGEAKKPLMMERIGGPMSFAVFVGGERGGKVAHDGEKVPASAALRFKVGAADDCHLYVLSVDQAGQVSRLFPAAGEAPPTKTGEVPGGAVLDGAAGPERLYAVCTPEPDETPYEMIEGAARAAASGGPEKVRQAATLAGLPKCISQATVLLEKQP